MRRTIHGLIALSLVLAAVSPAEAQRRIRPPRMPGEGTVAIGGNIGIAAPSDGLLNPAVSPIGNFEYYVTPRLSIRLQGGTAWNQFDAPRFGKNVRPSYLDINGVYNWEGGEWHPFVTAGFGVYHYKVSEPPFVGTNTEPGLNLGGGLEYFVTPRSSLRGEALYHAVSGHAVGPFATVDTSFWTASFGVKRYF